MPATKVKDPDPAPTMEVVVRQDAPLQLAESIDISGMQMAMEKFHEFVKSILKPGTHYGKVPGVAKHFLWQPGAEEIFRAFNVRPAYSTVQQHIDFDRGTAFFWRKCEAIHIDTGTVVGEADAICSHEEFRAKDGTFGKGGFGPVVSNALMKADKRAFVKCARTLGCASEFFTQDEDLISTDTTTRRTGASGPSRPVALPKDPQTGDDVAIGYYAYDGFDKDNNPVLKIKCPNHGWWYAMEWGGKDGKPKQVKCKKKDGEKYCQFVVAMPEAPKEAVTAVVPDFDRDAFKKMLDDSPKPGTNLSETLKPADVATFLGVEMLKPSDVTRWLAAGVGRTVQELIGETIGSIEEKLADGEPVTIEGEVTELPFDEAPVEEPAPEEPVDAPFE